MLDELRPDVIHSHNLPDGLTVAALELADVPVIHDSHDMQSLRQTAYEDGFPELDDPIALEQRAVEGSAGLVTVSDEMLEQIRNRYRVPDHNLVFANYAPERDLPTVLPPPLPARTGPAARRLPGHPVDQRRPLRPAPPVHRAGGPGRRARHLPVEAVTEYGELADAAPGMRCHEPLEPSKLLQELAAYDFGWAGFNDALNGPHLDTVLPNKLFEYLGCGLPVLTLRTARAPDASQGRRHRARVGLGPGRGAGERRRRDAAARVAAARPRYTVEREIERIAALSRDVTDAVELG